MKLSRNSNGNITFSHAKSPRFLSTNPSFVSLKKDIDQERMCMQRWGKHIPGDILLFSLYIKKIGVHLFCQHGI